MDIEGLGEAVVEQLVSNGLVETVPDIYRLEASRLAALERMAARRVPRT